MSSEHSAERFGCERVLFSVIAFKGQPVLSAVQHRTMVRDWSARRVRAVAVKVQDVVEAGAFSRVLANQIAVASRACRAEGETQSEKGLDRGSFWW